MTADKWGNVRGTSYPKVTCTLCGKKAAPIDRGGRHKVTRKPFHRPSRHKNPHGLWCLGTYRTAEIA